MTFFDRTTTASQFIDSMRKIAFGLGAFVVLLLAALLVIPIFFGDRIASHVKAEVNRSVNAQVGWDKAGVSLLRDFPNVSLTLNQLSVVGIKPFERDTLLAMRKARLALDVRSVVGYLRSGRPIIIREITLEQPAVRLRRLADGATN